MKRILVVFGGTAALILILALSLISCKKAEPALKIVDFGLLKDEVSAAMNISMPKEIDEQMLQSQYGLSASQVEKFSGITSASMTSADTFLAIMGKEGNTAAIESAFQKRIEDIKQSFANNLEAEKLNSAKIIKKDDYVFLVISDHVKEVEKIINSRF